MSMRFMTLLLARDLDGASEELGVRVPDALPEQLDNFLQFRIADLEVDPEAQPWLGRAIVLTEPDGTRRFVGTAGFHAPPGRRRAGRGRLSRRAGSTAGRASPPRSSAALFDWAAREHGIRRFRAVGRAGQRRRRWRSSRGFGFRQIGVQIDDIDGEELVFELDDWTVTPPTP